MVISVNEMSVSKSEWTFVMIEFYSRIEEISIFLLCSLYLFFSIILLS